MNKISKKEKKRKDKKTCIDITDMYDKKKKIDPFMKNKGNFVFFNFNQLYALTLLLIFRFLKFFYSQECYYTSYTMKKKFNNWQIKNCFSNGSNYFVCSDTKAYVIYIYIYILFFVC